ncbi:MAG: hypothetical protein AB7N65_01615 [Vicinamibacterales bacterium]
MFALDTMLSLAGSRRPTWTRLTLVGAGLLAAAGALFVATEGIRLSSRTT